jgi:hypothetical protein
MTLIRILALLAFAGSIFWFVKSPDYEPGIAIITSLAALIANEAVKKRKGAKRSQSQTLGKGAVGIQAGRDANVGNIDNSKK